MYDSTQKYRNARHWLPIRRGERGSLEDEWGRPEQPGPVDSSIGLAIIVSLMGLAIAYTYITSERYGGYNSAAPLEFVVPLYFSGKR